MAKILFLTDSASDIPDEFLEEFSDIMMVPFLIQIGDESYEDRVTMTPEDFYEVLEEEDEHPTHAQITPFQFGEIFFKAWKDGYTHVIFTSINNRGSATYRNASQAAHSFEFDHPAAKGKMEFTVIDSKSYSLAYGYAVVEGARMAKAGKEPEEIIAFIKDWVKHAKVLFVPFSLKAAKKSGRINATTAFVGEALGMRPVMTFTDGESMVLAKVRGEKNIVGGIMDQMAEDRRIGAPYCILRSTVEDHEDDLMERCEDEIGYEADFESYAGGVIAANAGTRMLGVMYRAVGKKEENDEPWEWKYEKPKPLPPGIIP